MSNELPMRWQNFMTTFRQIEEALEPLEKKTSNLVPERATSETRTQPVESKSWTLENKPLKYEPLERRQIRLLRAVSYKPHLQLELSAFNMDEAPPYCSLSYTWGEPEIHGYVRVNGRGIEVRKNLGEALSVLAPGLMQRSEYFWVDALCINQNDLEERASQVILMKDIFQNATRVRAWLGEADKEDYLAIYGMRAILMRVWWFCGGGDDGTKRDLFTAIQAIGINDVVFGQYPGELWAAIKAFCNKPWWSRAWVVQEASAPRQVIYHCGVEHLTEMALLVTSLVSKNLHSLGMKNVRASALLLERRKSHFDEVRPYESQALLLNFLGPLRWYYCSDPRDRIYAVLSLASDIDDEDIYPDYHIALEELYSNVVHACIRKATPGHALDFLGHVIRPTAAEIDTKTFEESSLPTWVPDWRVQKELYPFRKWNVNKLENRIYGKVYSAAKETATAVRIEGRKFHVDGFIVNKVEHVSKTTPIACEKENLSEPLDPFEWVRKEYWKKSYHGLGTFRDAVKRTMLADHLPESGRGHSEKDHEDPERKKDLVKDVLLSEQRSKTITRRRWIWTSGDWVGIGPASTRPGDKVCVFFGGQMLYVIREKEHPAYEFVGECFVNGLMDGEAIDQLGGTLSDVTTTFVLE